MSILFEDRRDAGRQLAAALGTFAHTGDLLVLALPRGGVPVAYEVARALGAELDVLVVRKIGVPGHSELAMGAIAGGDVEVIDSALIRELGVPNEWVATVARKERAELARREQRYRGNREALSIRGRTVILVDDGIATGASMHAAISLLRRQQPARLVVAVPLAPAESLRTLAELSDELICIHTPRPFNAVGAHYRRFDQTSDQEVQDLLAQANAAPNASTAP